MVHKGPDAELEASTDDESHESPPETTAVAVLVAPDAPVGVLAYPESQRALAAYLGGQLSPRSKQNAADALKRLSRLILNDEKAHPSQIPWASIVFEEATRIRTALFEATRTGAITPGTANLTLSHLRGLIKTMYGMGLVTERQLGFVHSGALKGVPGKRAKRGRALTLDEEKTLRAAARGLDGYQGAMLDTMIVFAVGGALRREEIARLPLGALRPKELSVLGKGNNERIIPLDPEMREFADAWLEERGRLGVQHAGLFCSPQKPEWVLSPWSFWALVRKAAHAAFGEGECTKTCPCLDVVTGPHDFRRTFATRLLDQGLDIGQVQVLMGHASPTTTALYDKRDLAALYEKRRNMKVIA